LGQDAGGDISHLTLGRGGEASPRNNTHMIPANSWMNSMAAINNRKLVLADAPTNFEILQEQNAEPGLLK
jgi:hypothetical protein